MRITKEKKGAVLLYGAIAGLLAAIVVLVIRDVIISQKDFVVIGSSSLSLIKHSKEAEKTLFYIDQSAKYALQQSVYDLAGEGGFSKETTDEGIILDTNECGRFGGFNIWYNLEKDKNGKIVKNSCFDEKLLVENLESAFAENMDKYLSAYPYDILLDNYDYEIKGSLEIVGKAREPLAFEILKDESKPSIKKARQVNLQLKPKKTEEIKSQTMDFEDFTGTDLCQKGKKCLLTNDAYNLLLKSQEIAKQKGILLEVTSAYRSMEQQIAIWEAGSDKYPDPKIRRKYIANPYECKTLCPHATGNVVDIHFKGKPFAMNIQDSSLLLQIMSQAGWVRYSLEGWHFECCGTDRYTRAQEIAKKTGKQAIEIV